MSPKNKDFNLSVIKAFSLLNAFLTEEQEWGVSALAKKSGYNKTTTYRLLSTLESLNVVKKNTNDKYILGLKLFELGHAVSIHKSLKSYSQSPLEYIAKNINETVHLGVLSQDKVLYINKIESLQGLKVSTQIGSYQKAYCTAIGKVLLAFSNKNYISEYLKNVELHPSTINTITDSNVLLKEFIEIKEKGYALDMEELEIGLICIAIPVFNKHQDIVASISVSGPSSRFEPENIENYLAIIKKGALKIETYIASLSN